jgi:hypothetical protein
MSLNVQTVQLTDQTVAINWSSTGPDPVSGFEVAVSINAGSWIGIATMNGTLVSFYDTSGLWTIGDVLNYRVRDRDLLDDGFSTVTVRDLLAPPTYGPPRPDASAPRYTSLETVKRRMGIPAANTDRDADLLEAIIGAEISIDYELGRSFPDTGLNPAIRTVPASVTMLATSAAIAVYKAGDAPFGTAGSDDWFGAVSIADVASQTIRRSPLIRGLQVSFGVG